MQQRLENISEICTDLFGLRGESFIPLGLSKGRDFSLFL